MPKLQGYIREMAINIAGALDISAKSVNIKATTNEGMGFIGRNEGVAAFAVVSLREKED
jgi:2-C-methyl-D-erythritol 2,4-cyclodiphosphate synthase